MSDEIITLQPAIDPRTGQLVYTAPPTPRRHDGESVAITTPHNQGGDMAHNNFDWQQAENAQKAGQTPLIINGQLVVPGDASYDPGQAVTLTDDRFAGDPVFDWGVAERAQDAGQALQIIDGRLVPAGQTGPQPGQAVTLTDDRFAATAQEGAEVLRLVQSGTASHLIADLQPTSELRSYFQHDPGGWYLRTKPTPSHRDVLHTVIVRRSATGLYHAHLWRFMQCDRGELKNVDLNRWVGTHERLSAHKVHLYPGRSGEAAILCLSQRTTGGMPDLTGTVLQAAKWADGMGYVVRGGTFPYRQ